MSMMFHKLKTLTSYAKRNVFLELGRALVQSGLPRLRIIHICIDKVQCVGENPRCWRGQPLGDFNGGVLDQQVLVLKQKDQRRAVGA